MKLLLKFISKFIFSMQYYSVFISLRYIKSRLITIFSIIGVAIGVMVLIVVLSVMDGFRKEFISRLQGILSHIVVGVKSSELNYKQLEKKILSTKHVKSCAPHYQGVILIGTNRYYVGGMVIGIDYDKEITVGKFKDYLVTAYKELKLDMEKILERNITGRNRVELSWKVIGGAAVAKEGRSPAGIRIIVKKTYTYIPNNKKNWPQNRKYPSRSWNEGYTINDKDHIVYIEKNLSMEDMEDIPTLQNYKKWQNYFHSMAASFNERKIDQFMSFYNKKLQLASGSLDPNQPFKLYTDELDVRPVIVGHVLMQQLGLKYGEEITLMTGKKDTKKDKLIPFSRKFIIAGAFKSGWQEIDARLVYTKRKDLVGFLDIPNDVTEISVSLNNYKYADEAKSLLTTKLNGEMSYFFAQSYPVQKWEDRRRALLAAINMERLVMTIIVSLIVVLAVVSIMIILILMVTEKTKDIGILKSMGATDWGIMSIFISNGLFISTIGALIGSGMGTLFTLYINSIADFIFEHTGFRVFPPDIYYLDRIPTQFSLENIIIIVTSTVIFSILACTIPAFKASRMDAVEALNSEAPSMRWLKKRRKKVNIKDTSRIRSSFFCVEDLTREYTMGHQKLKILDRLNLTIKEGEIMVILGSSGAGKSTLLHLMGLLDTPTEGSVYHNGINLNSFSYSKQAEIRSRDIGFVFQFYHLLPELNALENVLLGAMIQNGIFQWFRKKKEIIAFAKHLLKRVGLEERMNHRPVELSGGERQRVAIARALITKPRILFCDEPTGNLDEDNSVAIQELLWELNKEMKQTFVIVTHENRIAKRGDRVFKLTHGKLHQVRIHDEKEIEVIPTFPV